MVHRKKYKGGRKPTKGRNDIKKMRWGKKPREEIASMMKSQVNKQVDTGKQEKSELSEVASILSAINKYTDPRTATKSGSSNADMDMATAVFINGIIQRKHENPWRGTQPHCEGPSNSESCLTPNAYMRNLVTY